MKRTRILKDYYPTETRITDILLKHIQIKGRVLEPCCGDNHITNTIITNKYLHSITEVVSTDINQGSAFDATTALYWENHQHFDWIITNPPYNQADKIVPLAYQYCNIGIAMLLRLSWLEPTKKRANYLIETSQHLRKIIILNPRPSFRNDTNNTDSVTSAWLVWTKAKTHTQVIFEIDWK